MLILFVKSQLGLFDMPTMISGSVRKDGTIVAPHVGMRKKRLALPAAAPVQADMFGDDAPVEKKRRAALDALLRKYGGAAQVAAMMLGVPDEQRERALAAMAKIARVTPAEMQAEMQAELDGARAEDAPQGDLFAAPVAEVKPTAPTAEQKAKMSELRETIQDMMETRRLEGKEIPQGWLDKLAEADAVLGPVVKKKNEKAPEVDMSGWTGHQITAYELRKEYEQNSMRFAENPKTLGEFKRKLRREAKRIPSSDEKAVFHIEHLVNRIWGTDYDPKVADIEFAPAADAAPHEGERNAEGLVFKDGRWHRDETQPAKTDAAIVEYITKKGKKLTGIVRMGITLAQAKEIDPYAFRLNGGMFIREKYLGGAAPAAVVKESLTVQTATSENSSAVQTPSVEHDRDLPFGVAAGTSKADRRRLNAAAADLVATKTTFDDADRAILRQYSGNGGCGDSLNEFYTDPAIAGAIWDVATRLGYESGTAGEFSCGTGVFLHTAPAGFKVTGVELDPVSASIATALHGDRHEIQNASLERFATQDMRQFNVVVGNPPYGPRGMLAKDDKVDLSKAEEYFIDTSLDKTAPGGLCSLVVPAGIMDSKNGRGFRERILRKAEFLGAQRMPNTAFEAAHTDVTADILYFRKRADDVAGALGTVDQKTMQALGVWDAEFLSGGYFEGRGASNVFGTVGTAMRAFGEIYTVDGSMHGVAAELAKFEPHAVGAQVSVPDILAALPDEAARNRALNGAEKRPYQDTAKVGDIRTIEGIAYVLQGNPPRWHRVDEALQSEAVTDAQDLAAEIERLMTGAGAVDRPKLEADVRAWVEKHGNPAKNANLLVAAATDKTLYRLIGAVGKDGTLSDVVAGRRAAVASEGGFDTIARALALNHDSGAFTHGELSESLGQDREEVLDRLVADTSYAYQPNVDLGAAGSWAPMDIYLTGELWPKLDEVRAALGREGLPAEIKEKLELQARRLEETIDPKSLEDVDVSVNSAFLPLGVIEAWIDSKTEALRATSPSSPYYKALLPANVEFKDGLYTVDGGSGNDHHVSQKTGIRHGGLLEKYLNRMGVEKDDLPAVEQMNEEFKDWLCASPRRDEIEELYNRKFRGFVQRDFSNEPIDVPGLANHDAIKGYQWPGLRWALAAGKGIIAADVGLGKTLRGLLLARMAKLEGRAQKPTIVVPKSVLANWYAETQKWFPGSKVLTIGATFSMNADGTLSGKDDNANERKRKYHDLSQNDYDFVLISEPAFQEIDLDPITKGDLYENDFWVQRGKSLGNAGDKTVKKIREQYEQAIAKREFREKTDAIYFNEIGVDMLIADEMHHVKGLFGVRSRFGESPKFMGGGGISNRALDFNLKSRWLLGANGNKGVYGLTATPTKNSPIEVYNMLSHIAPEAFENVGIRNSEEFIDRFCEFTRDTILSTNGELVEALVTSGFKNMSELREIMGRYIDRTTAEQVGLELPKRSDHMHFVQMSPAQEEVYEELRSELEDASKKDATGDAHIFSIMTRMGKAALDLEVLDGEKFKGAVSPKYSSLAKHVKEGMADGGQIVFSDSVVSHDKIIAALVDSGVKREHIGVINAKVADSSVKRQNVADAFNSGKLKVVIGNTQTMGEGINLQMGTADIHHLDTPWTPAEIQQRNGRGLRQGNIKESVRIHTYLAKASFDGYRYQTQAAKKDWQEMLWSGGDRVDNLSREGKFSRQEIQIMMAADPEAARAKIEGDMSIARAQHESGERVKAAEVFVRFQELKAGYAGIKNKNTASAERLRRKLDDTKTSLKSNRFFTAKSALDSDTVTVIQPQTGLPYHAGVAFHAVADDGADEGKFVVTGVNLRAGTVTVRPYASASGARSKTVALEKLAHGVTPFNFDAEAEGREVAAEMEKRAADRVNNIDKWDDIKTMPSTVLEAAHDSIQRQLFQGAKDYSVRFPYGEVPMIHKETGKIERVSQYSVKEKEATHDFLLPTDANKDKALQAWMDEERTKKYGQTSFQKRKNSRTEWRNSVEYPGADYNNRSRNPMTSILNDMSEKTPGISESSLVKEAKERFAKEQIERVRRAPTFKDALAEAVPLSSFPEYGGTDTTRPTYNKRALAMLWARAKHEGILDKPFDDYVPSATSKYSSRPLPVHHNYTWHAGGYAGDAKDVHGRLQAMIAGSGHKDLDTAVRVAAHRQGIGDAKDVLSHLDQLGIEDGAQQHYQSGRGPRRYPKGTFDSMLKVAEAAGLADTKLKDADVNSWGILSSGHKYDSHLTIRQAVEQAKKEAS